MSHDGQMRKYKYEKEHVLIYEKKKYEYYKYHTVKQTTNRFCAGDLEETLTELSVAVCTYSCSQAV